MSAESSGGGEGERRRAEGIRVARLLLVIGFLYMCRKLLVPTMLGAVFAIVLDPLRARLEHRLGRARALAPAIVTTLVIVLVVAPSATLGWKAVGTANDLLSHGTEGVVGKAEDAVVSWLFPIFGNQTTEHELHQNLHDLTARSLTAVAQWVGSVARELPDYVTSLFLFVLSLYYFARDGRSLLQWLRDRSPVQAEQTAALFEAIRGTVNGTILGTIVVASVQGALTLIFLLALKVPAAFLWGLVATVCSVLPVVGTTPVTIGAAIYLALTGHMGKAAGMVAAAVFIGSIDNVIRPAVVSSHDDMHPLVALLAIFGGLSAIGPSGVFLGPVVASIALWAMKADRAFAEA